MIAAQSFGNVCDSRAVSGALAGQSPSFSSGHRLEPRAPWHRFYPSHSSHFSSLPSLSLSYVINPFYQTNPSHKFVTHFQSMRTANHVSVFLAKTNPNLTLPTGLQPGSVSQRLCSKDRLVAPAQAGRAKSDQKSKRLGWNQTGQAKIKPNLTLFKVKNEINLDPFNPFGHDHR
jgi:hypothetical protein